MRAVLRHWLWLVATVVFGLLGALQLVRPGVTFPPWLLLLGAVAALFVAQFLAFHDVRIQRDALASADAKSPRDIFKERLRFQIEIGETLARNPYELVDYVEDDRWPRQTTDFLKEALAGKSPLSSTPYRLMVSDDEGDAFDDAVYRLSSAGASDSLDPDVTAGVAFLKELESKADTIQLSMYWNAERWMPPERDL